MALIHLDDLLKNSKRYSKKRNRWSNRLIQLYSLGDNRWELWIKQDNNVLYSYSGRVISTVEEYEEVSDYYYYKSDIIMDSKPGSRMP